MGEATFYLKAEFENEHDANQAYTIAQKVFEDLMNFQNDWQKIRDGTPVIDMHNKLLKDHKLVALFISLPEPKEDDRGMNYLAGNCEMPEDFELKIAENEIYLSAYVWHLATWDNIQEFFFKLGAIRCGWVSDEYLDPWENVENAMAKFPSVKKFDEEMLKKWCLMFKLVGVKNG